MIPNILGPIEGPLTDLLKLLTGVFDSYGLAIIVFTIMVRGILSPLNLKQLRSAKKMALLGPRLKEIQRKYKGNREEVTKQTMALYKEEGVNPAAGCLPLLIQMPVLYALFFIFRNLAATSHHGATAIYHAHFLWFTLDAPDKLFGPFVFPGTFWGPLPLMAAGAQWVQSRMMMQPTSDPQQRTTQQIMQFLPLFILLFAVRYPAGLALYWVTSTMFSIVMQYFITGWGQLFKSPLKIPDAGEPAVSPTTRLKAPSPSGSSSAGRSDSAEREDGKKTPSARAERPNNDQTPPAAKNGHGARPGKMQRAAMRSFPKGTVRHRASKGAKR